MNIILVEDTKFPIGSIYAELYKDFPHSSRINITEDNFFDNIKHLHHRPLLNKCWLVNISPRVSSAQVKEIMQLDNINIIQLTSTTDLEKYIKVLKDIKVEFKVINNLQPDKNKILVYIIESLGTSLENATYICNRHRWYLPSIVNSVTLLSTLDNVTKDTIKRYTTRFSSVSLHTLVQYLLGVRPDVNKKAVLRLVYDFRYGTEFLLDYIKKELDKYLIVFEYISSGLLSLENMNEFTSDDKVYKGISKYRLGQIIEAYSVLSFDKLYFIRLSIEDIKSTPNQLYKLLILMEC